MNEHIDKILDLNGKSLIMLARNGMSWIAIEPICEILGVDSSREIKKIEESVFLTEHSSVQTMVSADGKLQKMFCLPEYLIYKWILKIESDDPGLADLKSDCYGIIYDNSMLRLVARKCK